MPDPRRAGNGRFHPAGKGRKGEITVGADADLVIFDDDIDIPAVYLMGRTVV